MSLIQLSDAINNLRSELSSLQEQNIDKSILFEVNSISIELEVVALKEASGSAKANWWIIGGEIYFISIIM